jgi:hypothetical protein
MQRTLDLHYDKLVIGADLSALRFCYTNKTPLIFIRKKPPFLYDSNLLQEYNKLMFFISLNGLIPFSNLISAIRIENDQEIKIVTKNNLLATIKVDKLYLSDDFNISGLSEIVGTTGNLNFVIDYQNVHSGLDHSFEEIETDDKFISKIKFFRSPRFAFIQETKKDCAGISYITNEELDKFEFSEVAARMKILSEMKKAGIHGRWDKTNNRYKPIKLVSNRREIYQLWKNIYDSSIEQIFDAPPVIINEENLYELQKKSI